jgi:hypothetical protein
MEKEIDNAEEITLEQCDAHFSQLKAVDQKNASQSWEKKYESLQRYAMFLVDKFPDIEWRGTDRTFAKKLNPPSLNCQLKRSYSSSNVIPDELIFSVPEKYRECKILWILKSDMVKDDLKAGKELNFAKLDRKEALQVKVKIK